jgi:hypothetical protein
MLMTFGHTAFAVDFVPHDAAGRKRAELVVG